MIENENTGLETVDTGATSGEATDNSTELVGDSTLEKGEEKVETKTFTQEDVNALIQKRLEKDRKSFFNKLGVEDENILSEMLKKSKLYDEAQEEWSKRTVEHNELVDKYNELLDLYAFTKNNIDESKYDDVKIFFKGKELELNDETLAQEVLNHNEWLRKEKIDKTPKTTITKLGLEQQEKKTEQEKEKAFRYLGV